ncbi:MAG: phosphoenolpyruvate carboxykinase (ATP), partial [Chlorobi bacterium]|nr:phosphoenolpyruvate carboxykinase (ATP) [Chlorobiota bacterium]
MDSKINRLSRRDMIRRAVAGREALVSESGALATWTPRESTGRSPKDTWIVKHGKTAEYVDWTSPNNQALDPETFDMLVEDALNYLDQADTLYETRRVIGADPAYALPVRTVTTHALAALFTDNMFRPVPPDLDKSIFKDEEFILLHVPYRKLDEKRYEGRLRELSPEELKIRKPGQKNPSPVTDMAIAMDFERKIGVIIGSAYMGSMKKMLFTVMNYLLPFHDILPLHCSANEGEEGDVALLLGLSGTGKTTLSADPKRKLLGDDEHGWSDRGIANFENGCYAKLINITAESEPEIYNAVMHRDDYENHGSIVENAMIYPNGKFDFFDDRFTPNSRASYPLRYLSNVKESAMGGHPSVILFLTADAYGVLPPISKLTPTQAMLWFLLGYTSKLAGTETGVTEPKATFSRFFGQPFMPLKPHIYADMLGEKMKQHQTDVYLVNTGWTGGPYGVGHRIPLEYTRRMVDAAISGELKNVEYTYDPLFHLYIPKEVPGVPSEILIPANTWQDQEAYKQTAEKLARLFSEAFDKNYGNQQIDPEVVKECPGK